MESATHKSKRGVHKRGGWTEYASYPCGRVIPQSNNSHSNITERLHKKNCEVCKHFEGFLRHNKLYGTISDGCLNIDKTIKTQTEILYS